MRARGRDQSNVACFAEPAVKQSARPFWDVKRVVKPTSAVDHAMPHTSTRLRFNFDLPRGFVIDPEACPT